MTENNVILTFENKCTNKQTGQTRQEAVPLLRPFVAERLFTPRPVHVKLAIDIVTVGQVPVRVFRFLPVSIIPHSINAPYSFNTAAI